MNEVELSHLITDAARQVRQTVGAGLNVAVYRDALAYALRERGLTVERRTVPAGTYQGVKLAQPKTIDLVVNDQVVVLCKTAREYQPVFEAEALADLRVTGLKLALVINFGAQNLRDAVRRVVNQVP